MKKKKDEPTMGYIMRLFELSRMLDDARKRPNKELPEDDEEE